MYLELRVFDIAIASSINIAPDTCSRYIRDLIARMGKMCLIERSEKAIRR